MAGFPTKLSALETYVAGFSDGRGLNRLGAVTVMAPDAFQTWAKESHSETVGTLLNAFYDHHGIPGHKGGSLPKGQGQSGQSHQSYNYRKEPWWKELFSKRDKLELDDDHAEVGQTDEVDAGHGHYLHQPYVPPPKWNSAGAVVYNNEGKIALVAPKGGFGGYKWTFPKGTLEEGEDLKSAAAREVEEESGITGTIGEHLGQHEGTSSFTDYYLMKHQAANPLKMDDETSEVKWVTPEEAADHLDSVRDLRVLLKAVYAMKRAGIKNSQPNYDAILNAFIGHEGIPGHRGGSLPRGASLPPPPKFVSSNKANVAINEQAAAKILELAKEGKLSELKSWPESPSPKLNDFRHAVIKAMSGESVPAPKSAFVKMVEHGLKQIATPVTEQINTTSDVPSILDSVVKSTGLSKEKIAEAVTGNASPSHAERADVRARVVSAILKDNIGIKNAVLQLIPESGANKKTKEIVGKITKGDVGAAQKEYSLTPTFDISILGGIVVKSSPISGQALCNMGSRTLTMGSTSAIGDFRHELGHAIRASLGGTSHSSKNGVTLAIAAEYDKVKQRMKENPSGKNIKASHAWYEENLGVIGKRGLDNWEENFAESYRGYHKAIYQDKFESGNGKNLARFRALHPGMTRIFDAYYTAALLTT